MQFVLADVSRQSVRTDHLNENKGKTPQKETDRDRERKRNGTKIHRSIHETPNYESILDRRLSQLIQQETKNSLKSGCGVWLCGNTQVSRACNLQLFCFLHLFFCCIKENKRKTNVIVNKTKCSSQARYLTSDVPSSHQSQDVTCCWLLRFKRNERPSAEGTTKTARPMFLDSIF